MFTEKVVTNIKIGLPFIRSFILRATYLPTNIPFQRKCSASERPRADFVIGI